MNLKVSLFVTLLIVTQVAAIYPLPPKQNDHECKCLQTFPNESEKKYNSSQLYVFGGGDENLKIQSTASRLNSTTGKWETINSMPTGESHLCGAVSGKQIYLFGGFKGSMLSDDKLIKTSTAETYDFLNDTYTMLRSMPETRDECGAAALNGFIYVAGGTTNRIPNNFQAISGVLRYDIRTDQWSTVHPMLKARRGHQLVELEGRLYAIGGMDEYTSVEVYDATTDQWSFVASTQNRHAFFGATVHQGKIYVLSSNGFEAYSPSTNLWTTLNPPNDPAYSARPLLSMNGKLWTVGGEYPEDGKRTVSKSVFTYDTSTAHWVKQRDMDAFRTFHSVFVVNH